VLLPFTNLICSPIDCTPHGSRCTAWHAASRHSVPHCVLPPLAGYVERGGAYLGLCAGAYYACARVEFEPGTR
jgi:hypothetical protein